MDAAIFTGSDVTLGGNAASTNADNSVTDPACHLLVATLRSRPFTHGILLARPAPTSPSR